MTIGSLCSYPIARLPRAFDTYPSASSSASHETNVFASYVYIYIYNTFLTPTISRRWVRINYPQCPLFRVGHIRTDTHRHTQIHTHTHVYCAWMYVNICIAPLENSLKWPAWLFSLHDILWYKCRCAGVGWSQMSGYVWCPVSSQKYLSAGHRPRTHWWDLSWDPIARCQLFLVSIEC